MSNRPFDWSSIPNIVVRGAGRWCHARVEFNGKEHWRALRIQADEEGKNADVVRDAIRAFKVALAQDTFAILQLTRTRNEHSKLGEVFAAYKAASVGRDIRDDVVDRNMDWLKAIVRTVHGEFFDVANGRASLLSRDLLAGFQERRIAGVKAKARELDWTPEELEQRMKAARNTIKSAIQQARSLFARELLESKHYRNLVLPDLEPFLKFRAEGSSVAQFVRPPAEVWQKIVGSVDALKASSLAQWYAFQLGVNCGLRRGSARNARWGWCKELETGEAEMEVRRAKGGHYAIRLPADVWLELKSAKSSTDYIIPLATEEERDEAIDQVVDWLRECGVDARLPYHNLRKIYGAKVAATHGLSEAQNALGHQKADLTHAIYTDHRQTKSVRAL